MRSRRFRLSRIFLISVLLISAFGVVFPGKAEAETGPGYRIMDRVYASNPDRVVRFFSSVPADFRSRVAEAIRTINAQTGFRITIGSDVVARSPGLSDISIEIGDEVGCESLPPERTRGCAYTNIDSIAGKRSPSSSHVIFNRRILGDAGERRTILHEMSHALGLSHYNEEYNGVVQVMFYQTGSGSTTLQDGDVAGLRLLRQRFDNPIGNFEFVTQAAPKFTVIGGWTFDSSNTATAIPIHVYVNGRYFSQFTAGNRRDDVQAVFYNSGLNHGFGAVLDLPGGMNNVCVYAINIGHGDTNPLLGCRTVAVGGNPVGNLESATTVGPQQTTVSGWALDMDTTDSIDVHAYVDGRWAGLAKANLSRPDVRKFYLFYGAAHGFQLVLPKQQPGTHQVCVYGINSGYGNTNTLLGCRSFTTPGGRPMGNLEVIKVEQGVVRVGGWALDPDTAAQVRIDLRVNSRTVASTQTNLTRSDVQRVFPGYGSLRGFASSWALSKGINTVCVVARNIGTGFDTTLGCKSFTIVTSG